MGFTRWLWPPSTISVCPVTKAASSPASHTAARPMSSSQSPTRPMLVLALAWATNSGFRSPHCFQPGESAYGQMALTVIPS